jgi:glycerol-3-phosphate acyltransferase PlsY
MAPLALVIAYLLGSISFSILIVRLTTGRDVRSVGSGNAGATNVLRAAGKGAAVATMIGDIGKGVAAVLIAKTLTSDPRWIAAAAAAAVLGHVFPIFFGFRGGKGVATAAGAFGALAPVPLGCTVLLFVLTVAVSRYVSAGSVLAAALLPVFCWLWSGPLASVAGGRFAPALATVQAATVAALLVIGKHHENIRKLVAGTERKLGERKEP